MRSELPKADWVAVVPARNGSKGFPGKNLAVLDERPLFLHSVEHAIDAGASLVVISTDVPEILAMDFPDTVLAVQRNSELAQDDSSMIEVLLSLGEFIEGRTTVLLQPTSPLRTSGDILAALKLFDSATFDLVLTVTRVDNCALKYGMIDSENGFVPINRPEFCFSNRQVLPALARPNGAVYVFDGSTILGKGVFPTDCIGYVEMPVERSVDIDSRSDLEIARMVKLCRK